MRQTVAEFFLVAGTLLAGAGMAGITVLFAVPDARLVSLGGRTFFAASSAGGLVLGLTAVLAGWSLRRGSATGAA